VLETHYGHSLRLLSSRPGLRLLLSAAESHRRTAHPTLTLPLAAAAAAGRRRCCLLPPPLPPPPLPPPLAASSTAAVAAAAIQEVKDEGTLRSLHHDQLEPRLVELESPVVSIVCTLAQVRWRRRRRRMPLLRWPASDDRR
jgi:hypothetical protein